jgi:hypothetical protein
MRADDLDGGAERRAERFHAAGMVEMAVGQPDCLQRQGLAAQRGDDAVGVATGVDHDGAEGLLIPQDGAVLLERGDRDDGGG